MNILNEPININGNPVSAILIGLGILIICGIIWGLLAFIGETIEEKFKIKKQ